MNVEPLPHQIEHTMSSTAEDFNRDANDLLNLFTMLDGARISGGCDDCDAYQEIVAHAYGISRATLLKVHHDDDCPTLARYEGRATP